MDFSKHSLADFIDADRMRIEPIDSNYPVAFPIFSTDDQTGCTMWCAMEVYHATNRDVTIVVSETSMKP